MKNKELDSKGFTKAIKRIEKLGDFVKKKQEKKSDLLIDFERSRFLFRKEKISQAKLGNHLKKTHVVLTKLNKEIKMLLEELRMLSFAAKQFVIKKEPKIIKKKLALK
jgi:hypothetical protein